MRGTRTLSLAIAVVLGWSGAVMISAPAALAAATDDVIVIGDEGVSRSFTSGGAAYLAGPVAGAPVTRVDSAASTVTVSGDDAVTGGKASVTVAWPARPGSYPLDFRGPDPEQTVRLTRGAQECTFTSGTLTVHRAEATSTGQVAVLSVDVAGSCYLTGSSYDNGAQVRIGDHDPARTVSIPRATPFTIYTGALSGTVVTREVTVTNSGVKPWKIGTAAIAAGHAGPPLFKIVAESNRCTGLTLATGQTCILQVAATAWYFEVVEHLVVGDFRGTSLIVPLRLEGYDPVEPPTEVSSVPGRLSATISWKPPGTLPQVGYRIYDVTGGTRTLVATVAPSSTEIRLAGAGPRRFSVVAANGRFAESPDTFVEVASVSSEVIGNDRQGRAVAFATDTSAAQPRPLTVEHVDLDPSGTRWVTPARGDISVCAVATEQCTSVPGTTATTNDDAPRDVVWLPDGAIAFVRGATDPLPGLWVVRPDGSGLRKVVDVPAQVSLAAAPNGTDLIVLNYQAVRLERVRLADGRITVIPGTDGVESFTVSNQGLLIAERRVDLTRETGARITTVMNLDGSGARRLNLPAGDNRDVTFDPTGTKVAFTRYTDNFDATLWVAAADGSGARQLSTASTIWFDPKWSSDNSLAPTGTVNVPAHTTRTATLAIGAADGDDAVGSLTRRCRLDNAVTWIACGPTMTLSGLAAGTHVLAAQVTDPNGKQSAVITTSWNVDAVAPTATLDAPASVQTITPTTLTWTAGDSGGSGLASYDVRTRTASPSASFGPYQYPASWQNRSTRALTATLSKGYQYCFSVRARDRAGNVGAWSPERCTAMPLDDRDLTASTGWTRGSSTSYLFATYSRTTRTYAQLTRSSIRGRQIAVVATTCATCGSIDVYHAGVKLGRVSLYSSATRGRQVTWLPLQPVTRTGTVTIRSTGTRQILIDGLAIAH